MSMRGERNLVGWRWMVNEVAKDGKRVKNKFKHEKKQWNESGV